MNSFLLETFITFNFRRPFLSLGKDPFYLVQELLNKYEFKSKNFSVIIQQNDPICVLQSEEQQKATTIAFFNDRVICKLAYTDVPLLTQQFDSSLDFITPLLVELDEFLIYKWGVKGFSFFGNFMLLDVENNIDAAQIIADKIMISGYLQNPLGIDLKYHVKRTTPDTARSFKDFIRIFKAKFNGYVVGKANPENIGIQRELSFDIQPADDNIETFKNLLTTVKPYFSEENIKSLINIR